MDSLDSKELHWDLLPQHALCLSGPGGLGSLPWRVMAGFAQLGLWEVVTLSAPSPGCPLTSDSLQGGYCSVYFQVWPIGKAEGRRVGAEQLSGLLLLSTLAGFCWTQDSDA